MVKKEIGFVPHYIRFPGGSSNTVSRRYCQGIMSTLTKEVVEKGYQYYDWNGDSTIHKLRIPLFKPYLLLLNTIKI